MERSTPRQRRSGLVTKVAALALSGFCCASAFADVSVQVTGPSVTVSPPGVYVAPPRPARVVVAPPPPARVVVAPPPPPSIVFDAPPPLVVVAPGVQVVPDYDDEVYFVDGFYWVRRGHAWYRSHDHRGGWVVAQGGVPGTLVRMRPGRYRRYHAAGPPPGRPVVGAQAPGVVVVAPGSGHGKGHGGGHGHGRGHHDD